MAASRKRSYFPKLNDNCCSKLVDDPQNNNRLCCCMSTMTPNASNIAKGRKFSQTSRKIVVSLTLLIKTIHDSCWLDWLKKNNAWGRSITVFSVRTLSAICSQSSCYGFTAKTLLFCATKFGPQEKLHALLPWTRVAHWRLKWSVAVPQRKNLVILCYCDLFA